MDDSKRDARRDRVELFAAILIAVAALLTALATYQEDNLGDEIRDLNTEALAQTSFANDTYNDANAQRAIERDWFFSWISADENGEPAAEFLAAAMPSEVWALIEEWGEAEDDGIINPFSPEAVEGYASYAALPSEQLLAAGSEHDQKAECAIFKGRVAANKEVWLDLAIVFLTITLVTAGIAALLRSRIAQGVVLGTAILCVLGGAVLLLAGGDEGGARTETAEMFFWPPAEETPLDKAQYVRQKIEACDSLDSLSTL